MKLFFDHIFKTAGSSMQRFFSETFGPDKTTPALTNMKLSSVLNLYKEYMIIIGHFGFIPGESLPSDSYVTATVMIV